MSKTVSQRPRNTRWLAVAITNNKYRDISWDTYQVPGSAWEKGRIPTRAERIKEKDGIRSVSSGVYRLRP